MPIVTLDDIRNNRGGNGRGGRMAPAANPLISSIKQMLSTLIICMSLVVLFWRIFKTTVLECGCANTVQGFVNIVGNVAENCGTLWGSHICRMACAANGNEVRTEFYQLCVDMTIKQAFPDGQPVCKFGDCPAQHVLHFLNELYELV